MFYNSIYFLVYLLCASWFTRHVTCLPMRTHIDGKTSIWVTDKNTLNATQPLQERSLERRQWGGPGRSGPGGWGPGGSGPGGWGPGGSGPGGWGPGNQRGPWPATLYPQPSPTTDTPPPPPPPDTTAVPPPPPSTPMSLPSTSPSSPPPPPPPPATSTSSPPPPGTSSSPSAPDTSTVPPPPASTTLTTVTIISSVVATSSAPPPPPAATTTSTSPPAPTTTSTPPPPPTTTSTPPPPPTSAPPPPPTSAPPPASTTSTPPPPASTTAAPPPLGGGNTLQVSLVNNLGSDNVHAYITGLDSNGQVVMVTTDGAFYYVPSPGTTTPQPITANVALPLGAQGSTTQITIPDYISSARVWFADGTLKFWAVDTQYGPGLVEPTSVNPNDPSADLNWGFVELTFNAQYGLFANLSFVDFVGLPLGMQLQTSSSGTQSALGMPPDAVSQVCNKLKAKASEDGQPWDQLCTEDENGNLIRVVAPSTLIGNDASAFSNYWDDYINQVWQQYTSQQLTIDTQAAAGNVACTSDGTTITCDGDNRGYTKPSAQDIFGCNSGPFTVEQTDNAVHAAVVPRICAAMHRATLHMAGGNVQPSLPPSSYYQYDVNNWYSAYVHQIESEGKGYAFPYDDVSPNQNENVSGSVSAGDPTLLTVFIGGSSG